MEAPIKYCPKCKLDRTINDFGPDTRRKDGLKYCCKPCMGIIQRTFYEKNKIRVREKAKNKYQATKEKQIIIRKARRQKNLETYRAKERKYYHTSPNAKNLGRMASWRRAGIVMTIEKYNELLEKQDHKCDVCKKHKSLFKKALCVDHDHKTGKVRGLLCDKCNRSLGYLHESEEIINNLLNYIQCHK